MLLVIELAVREHMRKLKHAVMELLFLEPLEIDCSAVNHDTLQRPIIEMQQDFPTDS